MTACFSYDRHAAIIPFILNGHDGSIVVYYGKNDDPKRAGYDAIPGLSSNIIDRCRGFPVIHAKIEKYSGQGYQRLCGWIQIVTDKFFESYDEKGEKEEFTSVDVLPSIEDMDFPFGYIGYLPELFDAPCSNIGKHAKLVWVADTFLTTVPKISREEEISWIAGFRWGYIEYDKPEQKPTSLLPLEVTNADTWNGYLPFLKKSCKKWRFKTS